MRSTFERRGTAFPADIPDALSEAFANRDDKKIQWAAFLRRVGIDPTTIGLDVVIVRLRSFLIPLSTAIRNGEDFDFKWNHDGYWSHADV